MITNLVLLVFVLAMIYVWALQGWFSAFMHLVLTILAGTLALALWEPIVNGFLLERMPEYAWGVGLAAPFLLILFALRMAMDKLIPGNLQFNQIIDLIGGGAMGFLSALLTAGLIVIAFLFIGPLSLGYEPVEALPNGSIKAKQSLWIPADKMAGSFFTLLSDNAFAPWSGKSIGSQYGSLFDAAARFTLQSRPGARHTILPAQLEADWAVVTAKQTTLPKELIPEPGKQILLVPMTVKQEAFDPDGVFTVFPAQVVLAYQAQTPMTGVERIHPAWYVQRKTLGDFRGKAYVNSKVGVMQETITWAFVVPEEVKPVFLSVKNTRIELPSEAKDAAPLLEGVTTAKASDNGDDTTPPPPDDKTLQPDNSTPVELQGLSAKVSDRLGGVINVNDMNLVGGSVETDAQGDKRIGSFDGTVRFSENRNLPDKLRIERLAHPAGTAIVQVTMKINKFKHTLPKALAQAASLNPPQLLDTEGDVYPPIGYSVTRAIDLHLRYKPSQPIGRLAEITLDKFADTEELVLYFRVPRGVTIHLYRLGSATQQEINLPVPE